MRLEQATREARAIWKAQGLSMAIVNEGPHTDEFDEDLEPNGDSFGYCPVEAVPILYRHNKGIVEVLK